MIFERLANGVTRHHKKILVAWIVILAFVVPAMLRVDEVLVYQESEMVSGDNEALIAQDIIDEQFPTAIANSTLMIVITGTDVTSPSVRDFCLALESNVTADADIKYLESMTTVYSVFTGAITATVVEIGPMMYSVESEVNLTANLLYGVPSLYLNNWIYCYNATPDASACDAEAYWMTVSALDVILAEEDTTVKNATYRYFSLFTTEWDATWDNSTLVSDPAARAEYSIGKAAPVFIGEMPYPADQKAVMTAVLYSFGLDTFSNSSVVHGFSISMISSLSGIDDLAFLEEVYAMGPEYDYPEAAALASRIVAEGTISDYPISIPQEYLSGFVSPDNSTMLIVLSFSKSSSFMEGDQKPIVNNVQFLRDAVSAARSSYLGTDYETYVTGDAAISSDMESSMMDDMMLIEPVSIILIIVLMGVFFRSVVAQFIPLGSVMVALGVSQAIVFVVGSLVANIHYTVVTMLFSILIGVGTDYAMFIVARYREERVRGRGREEAVRTSVTWAGESISTSGATVMISFFALSFSNFSMIRTMGLVLGMAVGISLLVALTLVPSLLLVLGNRIFWPTRGKRWAKYAESVMAKRAQGHHGYFRKAATFSIKHAKAVMIAALLISVPTSYIFITADTSFDFIGGMSSGVESNDGITAMTDGFGAGRIMPTEIVIVFDSPVYVDGNFSVDALDSVALVTSSLSSMDNVKQVTGTTNPQGSAIDYRNLSNLSSDARASQELLMLETVGLDQRTVLVTVVLEAGPMTPESISTIDDIHAMIASLKAEDPSLASADVYVGGSTATIAELAKDLDQQFSVMEIIVVIGIFIVLLIVLGALLLSLFAILSIMLSITWAFAATVGLFGYSMNEPILWIIPLLLFIMLMGIGMDYNIFILTRIREEIHKGKSNRDAIVESLDWTGGIITALALIMGSAFAMMMVSGTMMLKEIGFALAFAILLDAMVVRTYIVPAMMTLLGKWGWWAPGPLQRERGPKKVQRTLKGQ